MTTYATDDGSIDVLEWGDGSELLVLLHATAAGPQSLAGLARELLGPDRRIVAPALQGYGKTLVQAQGDPLDVHAGIAAACLRLFPARRRVLLGHSVGGLVALIAALQGAPLDALVLYEPIAIGCLRDDDPGDVACRDWDRSVVASFERDLANGAVEPAIGTFVNAWSEVVLTDLPSAVRQRMVARFAGAAPRIGAEIKAASFRPLPPALLARLSQPVLVLQGTLSPEATHRMSARLCADLPLGQRVMVPGTRHMGPVQAPAAVAAAIRAVLATPPRAG